MTAARSTVTAALIVRDEAAHIEACLASLRPHVDALIVVDTGSTDGTPELAGAAGARVLTHAWRDDFAAARNASLDAVGTPWALVVDADERLEVEEGFDLPAWLRQHEEAGYGRVLVHSERDGTEWLTRLLRVDRGLRFRFPVHEQVDVGDEAGVSAPFRLRHQGYQNEAESAARQERYLAILETLPADDPHRLFFSVRTLVSLGRLAEVEGPARAFAALGQHSPADARLRFLAAVAANNRCDIEAANRWIREGIEAYPDYPGFHLVAMTLAARQFLAGAKTVSNPDHPLHYHVGQTAHWLAAIRDFLNALSDG